MLGSKSGERMGRHSTAEKTAGGETGSDSERDDGLWEQHVVHMKFFVGLIGPVVVL